MLVKMWTSLTTDQKCWDKAIQETHPKDNKACEIAVSQCICAAWKFHEIYVGGDDSPCMIQIFAASTEDDRSNTDVLARVLIPSEPVEIIYQARGPDVIKLLHSFWEWRPTSPVVIEVEDGQYAPLLCDFDGHSWTIGRLCAAHIQKILSYNSLDLTEHKLRIYSDTNNTSSTDTLSIKQ